MSTRVVARNLGLSLVSLMLPPMAGYLLVLMLALTTGATGVGAFALFTVLLGILQYVSVTGLDAITMRQTAADPAGRRGTLGSALSLAVLGGAIGSTVMFALPGLLQLEPTSAQAVRFGSLAVLPSALIVVVEAYLYGAERNPVVAGVNTAEGVLRIGLAAAALHAGWGAPGVVVVFAAARWAGMLVELWAAYQATGVLPIWPGVRACLDYGRSAVAFGFNSLVMVVLYRGDLVLLSKIVGEASFGIFYAGFRLVEVAMLLPAAANSSVYPTASRLWQASYVQARDTVEWAATMIMAVTLPISLVLVLEGPFVLGLLFPVVFVASAGSMAVLSLTLIPFVVSQFGWILLYAAHRQRLASISVAIMGATALMLNALLITRLGGLGTALSRLGWFSLGAVLVLVITARLGVPLRPQRIFGTPLLALVPAALILLVLHPHPRLGIPAAMAAYATGLALLGLAGPRQLRLRPEWPAVPAPAHAGEELVL